MSDTYGKLIALLDGHKASYRLIDHAPEGQTDKVSALRGHPVAAAAKCIVLIVKIGKKTSRLAAPPDAPHDHGWRGPGVNGPRALIPAARYAPGMGRTGMISTDSPGKIAKCGWFSNSFAAASCESARTTV